MFKPRSSSFSSRTDLWNNRYSNRVGNSNDRLENIINTMGELSAKSQGLKNIITTFDKVYNSDNRLYIKSENNLI